VPGRLSIGLEAEADLIADLKTDSQRSADELLGKTIKRMFALAKRDVHWRPVRR
jgi:hypothetical protein